MIDSTTAKQLEAKKWLKQYIKPTTTLIINMTKVSSSGMTRRMKVYLVNKNSGRLQNITYWIADLTGINENDDGLKVGGCGMDMTFWLADYITSYLFNKKAVKTFGGNGGSCLDWQTI